MSTESYLTIALGFFAGVSIGLTVTVCIMVWLFKVLQSNIIHQTVADLLDGSQSEDEDGGVEFDEAAEAQEEWWKK